MRPSATPLPRRLPSLLALFVAAGLLAAGCGEQVEIIIPDFDTAEQQYAFAARQQAQTLPSLEEDRREQQMRIIVAGYDAVINRFPDDGYYRPRAMVMKAELIARTKWPRAKQDALELLAEVERSYPEDDEVLAFSLFLQGILFDGLRNYERAQEKYREVFDRYARSADPKLREKAAEARSRYNRVRTRAESRL